MHVVVRTELGDAELNVHQLGEEVTLAELRRAVVPAAPGDPPDDRRAWPDGRHARSGSEVLVDGRRLSESTPLADSGVARGSVIDLRRQHDAESPRPGPSGPRLCQVGGFDAGGHVDLIIGRNVLGPRFDIDADRLGADGAVTVGRVQLDVDGHGSVIVSEPAPILDAHEATTVDFDAPLLEGEALTDPRRWDEGGLSVGDRVFRLTGDVPADGLPARRPSASGQVALNRPPRASDDRLDPAPIVLADEPSGAEGKGRPFPVFALIAPIPIAAVMSLVIGPRAMIFALFSPVMMMASWLEDRRRRRRAAKERAELLATESARVVADVENGRRMEIRRRLAASPDPEELVRRTDALSTRLWERRSDDDDAFTFGVAIGTVEWTPDTEEGQRPLPELRTLVEASPPLPDVPLTVDLRTERALGIAGPAYLTTPVARSVILQAAALHGPSDVSIVICTSSARAERWEYIKWLPHASGEAGATILVDPDDVRSLANQLKPDDDDRSFASFGRDGEHRGPIVLVVVDHLGHLHGRGAPLRPLLATSDGPARFVVLGPTVDDLPAICTSVLQTSVEGCSLHLPGAGPAIAPVTPIGLGRELAARSARALARLEDPEHTVGGGAELPDRVSALTLFELPDIDVDVLMERWKRSAAEGAAPLAALGISEEGQLDVDLVADGPHALIAGTTGAGKSELLRTLVLGLALRLDPDHLNFVLVDYKGGSAFDACAELPHTVGLVTDLDEHLGARMLRSLRAELKYREHRLRDAGVTDLGDYLESDAVEPLPRLVVVVDEFATVAAELPDFLPSLVDVAQRGRSLGIHMVLATQRPAGVLDNKIKANTNLRIALRVQDDGDSNDVIGTKEAASLSRRHPGRAYLRLGAGEIVQFQSAYVSGTTSPAESRDAIEIEPYVLHRSSRPIETMVAMRAHGTTEGHLAPVETDLARLVDATVIAATALDQCDQRSPCLDPLPEQLDLNELCATEIAAFRQGLTGGDGAPKAEGPPRMPVPFAVSDLPDEQERRTVYWEPGLGGNVLVYGLAGAGTSTLLLSLALAAARCRRPDDLHLYAIDVDTNLLAGLDGLPHLGARVSGQERERLERLLRILTDEMDRRRSLALAAGTVDAVLRSEPAVLLLIDNLGALRALIDEDNQLAWMTGALELIVRDGSSLGINVVMSGKSERAFSSALANAVPRRIVMRLADPNAYSSFGIRPKEVPSLPAGRAVDPDGIVELHVAALDDDLVPRFVAAVADAWPKVTRPPAPVGVLPNEVCLTEVASASRFDGDDWQVAIGRSGLDLGPALLSLTGGEHALVAGPPRSGKSSVLATLARQIRRSRPDVPVTALLGRDGPLADVEAGIWTQQADEPLDDWIRLVLTTSGRRVVLIDDADRITDASMARIVECRDDKLTIVVAGRIDELKGFGHWSKPLQRSRTGVLLRPATGDGDLLRVNLGAKLARFDVGRGYLVNDGERELVQVVSDGQ
ncbi:MAG: FtsK/SpoIIIE domain-containing protein [Actinomycetota bacterium]